jgi:hypothetical protein
MRLAVPPPETQSPLVIDADAQLSRSVPLQSFQPIPWRKPQVLKSFRSLEDRQLFQSSFGDA